jgi:hypothetical protein
MSTVHVFIDGESRDFEFDTLFSSYRQESMGINSATAQTVSSSQVKDVIAQELDLNPDILLNYDVEFEKNGNINVHPEAHFGDSSRG